MAARHCHPGASSSLHGPTRPGTPGPPRRESPRGTGLPHPHRPGQQPAFTVRTLADIEQGVRKASPGTYAMLENKLSWAPGSIDTVLAGGEPKETVPTLRGTDPSRVPGIRAAPE